jgi:hypothetical protein
MCLTNFKLFSRASGSQAQVYFLLQQDVARESCNVAVACNICPEFSRASLLAATFRNWSYTSRNNCDAVIRST